jgi:hypothetical protein
VEGPQWLADHGVTGPTEEHRKNVQRQAAADE